MGRVNTGELYPRSLQTLSVKVEATALITCRILLSESIAFTDTLRPNLLLRLIHHRRPLPLYTHYLRLFMLQQPTLYILLCEQLSPDLTRLLLVLAEVIFHLVEVLVCSQVVEVSFGCERACLGLS